MKNNNKIAVMRLTLAVMVACGMLGCAKAKTREEISSIINDNNFSVATDYLNDSITAKLNDEEWTYSGKENQLKFVDENNKSVIIRSDRKNPDDKLVQNSSDTLGSLDLTNEEMRTYLSSELTDQMDEYENKSTKEKLVVHYPGYESDIDQLSNDEADHYYSMFVDDPSYSFNELEDAAFLDDDNIPELVRNSISTMKYKGANAETSWSLEEGAKVDSGLAYRLYIKNKNTNIKVMYLYENREFTSAALFLESGASMYVDDVKDILAVYACLMNSIDSSIDSDTAIKIIAAANGHSVTYNGYTYYESIDDSMALMVYNGE